MSRNILHHLKYPFNLVLRGSLVRSYSQCSRTYLPSTLIASSKASLKHNCVLPSTNFLWSSCRGYAKKRDKGSKTGKKQAPKINITLEEMSQVINAEDMLEQFDLAISQLQDDYMKALAVRTNIGSVEELPVEVEGETYPINEIAEIHRKNPQLIIINCEAFPQYTKAVIEAIRKSGMNLNPQQEGVRIALPLPKVTKEHREQLAGKAKVLCNKCKDNIRKIHNTFSNRAKNSSKGVSEDLVHTVTQKILEYQGEYFKRAESLLAVKQEELAKG